MNLSRIRGCGKGVLTKKQVADCNKFSIQHTKQKQRMKLLKLLEGLEVLNQEENVPEWRWDSKNQYLVKSLYRRIIANGLRLEHAKFIWNSNCPTKAKILMWLINKSALLTWPNILMRGSAGSNICCLCRKSGEDTTPLMLHCEFSISTMAKM